MGSPRLRNWTRLIAAILPPFPPRRLCSCGGLAKGSFSRQIRGYRFHCRPSLPNGAIVSSLLLHRHAAIAGAVVLLSLQCAFAAETPTPQELAHTTAAGSYLAARHAGVERDSTTAAAYYLNVLKSDPRNPDLLSPSFLSVLTDCDIDEAGRLADRLIQFDRSDRIARLVIGIRALKQKQYALARQNFAQSVRGPVTDLTAALLSAWALSCGGDSR